jgi:hypothetical protein
MAAHGRVWLWRDNRDIVVTPPLAQLYQRTDCHKKAVGPLMAYLSRWPSYGISEPPALLWYICTVGPVMAERAPSAITPPPYHHSFSILFLLFFSIVPSLYHHSLSILSLPYTGLPSNPPPQPTPFHRLSTTTNITNSPKLLTILAGPTFLPDSFADAIHFVESTCRMSMWN